MGVDRMIFLLFVVAGMGCAPEPPTGPPLPVLPFTPPEPAWRDGVLSLDHGVGLSASWEEGVALRITDAVGPLRPAASAQGGRALRLALVGYGRDGSSDALGPTEPVLAGPQVLLDHGRIVQWWEGAGSGVSSSEPVSTPPGAPCWPGLGTSTATDSPTCSSGRR